MTDQSTGKRIVLDFGDFVLNAMLFDTAIARRFADNLPLRADLTQWGNELYGPVGIDLGEEDPVEDIPDGGIAYTNRGGLVCIFFGQRPAWPVDFIGRIEEGQWRRLLEKYKMEHLEIRAA